MFTKGIILSEADYRSLWVDFIEILRERVEELDEEERDALVGNREELEDWVKEQVIEMFDAVLEDNDAEEAVVFLKGKCHYVPDSEEFFYMSYREGKIDNVLKEIERGLKGGVKESMWKRRMK
jgi:hypothetical protein